MKSVPEQCIQLAAMPNCLPKLVALRLTLLPAERNSVHRWIRFSRLLRFITASRLAGSVRLR